MADLVGTGRRQPGQDYVTAREARNAEQPMVSARHFRAPWDVAEQAAVSNIWKLPTGKRFRAISIGPRSTIYCVELASENQKDHPYLVSVRSPLIGEFEGDLLVTPSPSMMQAAIADPQRASTPGTYSRGDMSSGPTHADDILELYGWEIPPPVFPLRAPVVFEKAASGAGTNVLRLRGRKRIVVAITAVTNPTPPITVAWSWSVTSSAGVLYASTLKKADGTTAYVSSLGAVGDSDIFVLCDGNGFQSQGIHELIMGAPSSGSVAIHVEAYDE